MGSQSEVASLVNTSCPEKGGGFAKRVSTLLFFRIGFRGKCAFRLGADRRGGRCFAFGMNVVFPAVAFGHSRCNRSSPRPRFGVFFFLDFLPKEA